MELKQYSEKAKVLHHFRFLPVIFDIRQTKMPPAVGRGRVHIRSAFWHRFRLWNGVFIFCDSDVISTSGSAAMLTPREDNTSPLSQYMSHVAVLMSNHFFIFEMTLSFLKLGKLLLLPVLVRHLDTQYKMVSPTVSRGYVYAA